MDNTKDSKDCEFLKRVTAYPVVSRFWLYTVDTYGKVKEYNGLIKYTLTAAESAVFGAADRAKPVLAKLEVQINAVDVFACRTLDKVEQAVPLIKSTPEEISFEAKKLYNVTIVEPALVRYNNLKSYGLDKVTAVTEYGFQKAEVLRNTKYGQMLAVSADQMLLKADSLLDEYIPPLKLDGQPDELKMKDDGVLVDKALVLSHKLSQRMIHHGLLKLQATVNRTDKILASLHQTLEQIRRVESRYVNATRKVVDERLALIKAEVAKLWEGAYDNAGTFCTTVYKTNLRYIRIFSRRVNFYMGLIYSLAVNDVPATVIDKYHAGLDALQNFGAWYYENAMSTPPVLWILRLKENLNPHVVMFVNSDHAD